MSFPDPHAPAPPLAAHMAGPEDIISTLPAEPVQNPNPGRQHFRPPAPGEQTAPKFIQIEQGGGPPSETSDEARARGKPVTAWTRIRHNMREPFSEFMGTMTMISFGDGVVAQVVLSRGSHGDYQSINWGWGIAVMLAVYVSGGVSGGHLNPAVTLANCVFRKFPWRKFPIYLIAQVCGCFMGAAIVYGNYRSAIDTYEGAVGLRTVGLENSTAGLFCTYPQPFLTRTGQFFSEFTASAILMMILFAIGDQDNNPAGDKGPLVLFFIIFGLGCAFGFETGYAMNLARDFGPRLFSYAAGYGSGVWTAGNSYWWIPCVAPFCGCLFGGLVYDLLLFTGDSPVNRPNFGLWRSSKRSTKATVGTMDPGSDLSPVHTYELGHLDGLHENKKDDIKEVWREHA
ncbi:hypothetical protein G7K_3878-t1 [Saitoella complicata NRRL Y-17804]|uniref:Aquaporin n=2 Tax=Saitoella complicata (strain BCRC 22490 / CBS 7301 / JCM 7358 / NBRC 10748 / NRRL Y-17804) TaxID=698492 RepID=A0A0E9NK03_SAICN|nr:hypothetical protein G7K_3878-t1 [Saitoella complicata NRRL Y-17804]